MRVSLAPARKAPRSGRFCTIAYESLTITGATPAPRSRRLRVAQCYTCAAGPPIARRVAVSGQPPLTSEPVLVPQPRTPLLGREAATEEVRHLLLRGEGELVTLLGPGGVGKTRLALAVAAALHAHFPRRVVRPLGPGDQSGAGPRNQRPRSGARRDGRPAPARYPLHGSAAGDGQQFFPPLRKSRQEPGSCGGVC